MSTDRGMNKTYTVLQWNNIQQFNPTPWAGEMAQNKGICP